MSYTGMGCSNVSNASKGVGVGVGVASVTAYPVVLYNGHTA